DAERAPAASVKRGLQGDDLVLAGKQPRCFQCALDGFGSAVGEERLKQSRYSLPEASRMMQPCALSMTTGWTAFTKLVMTWSRYCRMVSVMTYFSEPG